MKTNFAVNGADFPANLVARSRGLSRDSARGSITSTVSIRAGFA